MRVTFLTPNLPPATCGLADHSRLLGEALRRLGCEVSFVGRRGDAEAARRAGLPGRVSVWDGTPANLASFIGEIDPDWLWVQLAGYGYSRWGAPMRLRRALRRISRVNFRLRIAVCVHEVHCQPHQLGRKGWLLSRWQRLALAAVVRSGHLILPTIPLWRDLCIEQYEADPARVRLLPIAANVPPRSLSAQERQKIRQQLGWLESDQVAVAFGTWPSLCRVLERHGDALRSALSSGLLDRVVLVGGEAPNPPGEMARLLRETVWGANVQILGPQPEARVSEVLAASDVGLVSTPWGMWEKSGSARALEQAGLTLWIPGGKGHRVISPSQSTPTWDGLAAQALGWLREFAAKEASLPTGNRIASSRYPA